MTQEFRTYSGVVFDLFNPSINHVNIEDIAHSLSQICRFTGHTKVHYSVAQHCDIVSRIVPPAIALEGLLHEGEEPYTNDLNTQMKYADGMEDFRQYGNHIRRVVWRRFGLVDTPEVHQIIKDVDTYVCELEKKCLFKFSTSTVIEPWPAAHAEDMFLKRFTELFRIRNT